jgi:hypothetical protein
VVFTVNRPVSADSRISVGGLPLSEITTGDVINSSSLGCPNEIR